MGDMAIADVRYELLARAEPEWQNLLLSTHDGDADAAEEYLRGFVEGCSYLFLPSVETFGFVIRLIREDLVRKARTQPG